jgi:WD40 repeat protein
LLYTFEHGDWVSSLDFSPDGRKLVTGSFASQVALWDLESPRLIRLIFDQTQDQVLSVAFSPDGTLLAAGTVQGEVHFWEGIDVLQ